jgi:hypothetical protein
MSSATKLMELAAIARALPFLEGPWLGRQIYKEETFIAERPGRRWLVLKTLLPPGSVVPAEADADQSNKEDVASQMRELALPQALDT